MTSCRSGVRWSAIFAGYALLACTAFAQSISVDASRVVGTIRRLNDVDNGPLCQHGVVDLTRYYRELGVQNVRLHDVNWSYGDVLDMEFLFPDWSADPERTESYNFTASDFYVKTISDLGIHIIFRLGYSAEGKSATRHNAPPPSYEKWAAVVEHIVRHYNEGWDDGLHANIRYWEVWNEPDITDFWSGTPEQYYRLYEVTVRALKRVDPTLRVGGPALAGHELFLDGFLAYARQRALPLDFLSWHIYTQDPADVAKRAERFHEMLMRYGYAGAQSVLDEWNYGPLNWDALFQDASATQKILRLDAKLCRRSVRCGGAYRNGRRSGRYRHLLHGHYSDVGAVYSGRRTAETLLCVPGVYGVAEESEASCSGHGCRFADPHACRYFG
jgi:hypothetical protein